MSADHPVVDPACRLSPVARFYDEPIVIEAAGQQVEGLISDVWRSSDATVIRVDSGIDDTTGEYVVLPDHSDWTLSHGGGQDSYRHTGAGCPLTAAT